MSTRMSTSDASQTSSIRRPSRFLSTVLTGLLAVSGLALGGVAGAPRAEAAPGSAAECSIASNGSFESPNIQDPANPVPGDAYVDGYNMFRTGQGTISGWATVAGTIDHLRYYNNASDGDQSIDLWGTAPATLQQTFTGLVPGTEYTFSIDYSGLQASASRGSVLLDQGSGFTSLASLSPTVNAVPNGNAGVPETRAYTVTWATYTHTFVATGTSATIRLQNVTAPAASNTGLFIDNFTFTGGGPCQDFGDAPDSYGTTSASDGARHVVSDHDPIAGTAPVMLGAGVDVEADAQPNAAADGDSDDGLTAPFLIAQGATSSVTVSVANTSGQDVTLAGWVDLDGDGQFESSERATVAVPADSGTAEYTLGFPAGTVTVDTYARFRVFGTVVADPLPTGNVLGGEVEDHRVTVIDPELSVVKHAAPADVNDNGITDAGDTIRYTFTVSNSGDVPASDIEVSDPKIGDVTCPESALAPGATQTCVADAVYTITAADVTAGGVENSATATGVVTGIGTITSSPSTTYTPTTLAAPGLSIVKSASPSGAAAFTAGQVVTYTFVVTNTGNVPVSGVSIDDSEFSGTGDLSPLDCPPGADTVPVGGQVICTSTYTLTQADIDAGSVTNSASATGTPPGSSTVTSPPSEVTIPADPAPAIRLVKSATPAAASRAGDTITYSFAVTNTGNVTLSAASITETAFSGTGTAPTATCQAEAFAPGQTLTCTATYRLTQADVDAGTVTNTATATATTSNGTDPISSPSSAAVSIAPDAALSVVKSASVSGTGVAGDEVTYSFLVSNTGNVTMDGITIEEGAFSGTGTLGAITCPDTTLEPAEETTCTASYTLTQADVDSGEVTNAATVTGTPPGSTTTVPSDPSTTTFDTDRTAALTVVKSATPTTVDAAGDTVDYSFLVTNTGSVTLADASVDEVAFSGTGGSPVVTCPTGAFAPTASVTCTATYTATQADIDAGSITNTATATARPPAGVTAPVSDPSSATVTATHAPGLTVAKTADTSSITAAGQEVTYSFLVVNTGNVTMSDIAIDETSFSGTGTVPPAVCPQPSLAPGDQMTCILTYTVTQADVDAGALTNTATATGTPPGSTVPVPSAPSTSTVTVDQQPGLTVVKSASPAAPADFRAGETITYSFVVTNTGNVTMSGIAIAEGTFTGSGTLPIPTCPAEAGSLSPGEQVVCTTSYTATQADIDAGSITNTATAEGTPPGTTTPVPSEPSTVTVPEAPNPGASVAKTADTQKITHAGQVIRYSFAVTNTGNTTLTDPTIDERGFTGAGTVPTPVCPADPAALAPGQTIVCTATYTVVAADLTGRALVNTATVTVTPPGGDPVTSEPSTARITDVAAPAPASTDPLAVTGSTIGWGVGGLGFALLAAGAALMLVRSHRLRNV